MQAHRGFGEGESLVAAAPAGAGVNTAALVFCPVAWMGAGSMAGAGSWAQELYRLAYERAQAALRPSLYERALRASRN